MVRDGKALAVAAILGFAAVAAGCSGGHSGVSAAPGRPSGASTATTLPAVDPCSLVNRAQAQSLLGQSLNTREAPLGPTCILTDPAGSVVATVAVQAGSVEQIRRQMKGVQVTTSGTHQLVCGTYGKPMLVTSVGGGSFLEIAAPCQAAQKMAAEALTRLG